MWFVLCSWGDVGIQKLTTEMWSYLVLVVVHPLWRWSFNRGSTVNCINPTKGYHHAMFETSYPDRLWQKANNNVSAMEGELIHDSHGTLRESQKLNRFDNSNKTYLWSLHFNKYVVYYNETTSEFIKRILYLNMYEVALKCNCKRKACNNKIYITVWVSKFITKNTDLYKEKHTWWINDKNKIMHL